MSNNTKTPSFEDAMSELENIIKQIENNEIKLDDALDKYQKGISLIKFCQGKLANVEQQIKILDPNTDTLKELNIE